MNVTIKLAIDDTTRRTIRAALGRGGMATRQDVRMFVERAYADKLAGAPEPKPARKKFADAPAKPSRIATAEAAPDDAVCRHCWRTKTLHGRMAYSCLPDNGQARSTSFEAASCTCAMNADGSDELPYDADCPTHGEGVRP